MRSTRTELFGTGNTKERRNRRFVGDDEGDWGIEESERSFRRRSDDTIAVQARRLELILQFISDFDEPKQVESTKERQRLRRRERVHRRDDCL